MAGPRRVANDPERRQRIITAALEVIAEHGVHGTTHRRIAATAGVPLGSLTYYFDDLTAILEAAFAHLSRVMSEHYRQVLQAATGPEAAAQAVVDLICGDAYAGARETTALFEFYAYGNHNDAVRKLWRDWLLISRQNLMLHFSEATARALDVLIEGWPMHRVFEGEELDRDLVERSVLALVRALEPPSRDHSEVPPPAITGTVTKPTDT